MRKVFAQRVAQHFRAFKRMELCWSSRLEASIPRSKLNPTPIFLSRAVRIGIDALKRFPDLMSCLAEAFVVAGVDTAEVLEAE